MKSYVIGCFLSLSLTGLAFGQGFGSTTGGTTGRAGATTTGGSAFGGSSAFGSTSMGGLTSGLGQTTGGLGQSTGGIGQTGGFGQTGGALGGTASPFGAATGMFGIAGGSTTSSMLGAAAMGRSMGGMMGGMGGMGGRSMGGLGMGGQAGRAGFGTNNNQTQNQTKIRASVRLGFQVPVAPAAERSQLMQARLARIPINGRAPNVQVAMDGRTAVLRGRIATKADGLLVERLLKLEPGVDSVINELVAVDE